MSTTDELIAALKAMPKAKIAELLGKDFIMAAVQQLSHQERLELFGRSQLSNAAILHHLEAGNVVIDPFHPEQLNTTSYDVRLGQYYFQEQDLDGGRATFNIYDPDDVRRVWGTVQTAIPLFEWKERQHLKDEQLVNISPDDLIIPIPPGSTILGHTVEFIGGRSGIMTSHMKARSSSGRCFMEVCKCAGEGDVGFCSRWTMEFTNNSRDKWIPLVVGRRLAQIIFMEVTPINGDGYGASGKYQLDAEIEAIKKNWTPEDMLPKLYKDYEVQEGILGTTFLDD